MMKQTDMNKVREKSKMLFDCADVEPALEEYGGIFIVHPYTNSAYVGITEDGKMRMADIMNNKDDYNKWRKQIFQAIDSFTLDKIYCLLINNPYSLTWLKFIKPYLSKKDFSHMLGKIWVNQENPNGDANVSIPTCIKWFKEADKRYLMTSEDYKIYKSLPDEIEVFRGVSVGRKEDGLSYTQNKSKAEWFKKRFEHDGKEGYMIRSIIKKEDVLAYFNTRDEDELVVNSLNIKKEYI